MIVQPSHGPSYLKATQYSLPSLACSSLSLLHLPNLLVLSDLMTDTTSLLSLPTAPRLQKLLLCPLGVLQIVLSRGSTDHTVFSLPAHCSPHPEPVVSSESYGHYQVPSVRVSTERERNRYVLFNG